MKTKELIKQLQEADPEGTAEVVVRGEPIYFVEHVEGYYDGWYEVLIQDHSQDPYYNIVGTRLTREKTKVQLNIMGYKDVLLDSPDAVIEIDESMGEHYTEELLKKVAEERKKIKEIYQKVDSDIAERKSKENKPE